MGRTSRSTPPGSPRWRRSCGGSRPASTARECSKPGGEAGSAANLGRVVPPGQIHGRRAQVDQVVATVPRFADRWEALVVDDGSTDRTAEVVRRHAAEHPEIRLVRHERNLGYGLALRTGLNESRGDAVFFTDADLQFHLSDIERLLGPFESADVVVGYRIKRRDPWHRLFVAGVYHRALRALFDLHVRDVDCAFKLFDRKVIDSLADELESRSAFISPELIIRAQLAGFRVVEVGVEHYPRTAGKSKGATPKVILRTIGEMRRLRTNLRRHNPRPSA